MATEADIPAPICETKREESAKREDQAAIFPPNKLPKEEIIQSHQLHEVPEATESSDLNHETKINKSSEQTFEVEQILGSSSITEVSREANGVSSHSSKVAEKPGGTVNDTEISFVKSDKINDQPLKNITSEENSVSGSQENAETVTPLTKNVELSEEKVISNDKAVDTEKIEVPNTTGDASKEECPGDLNVAVKESSEKTKKDAVSFLKSELTDYPEALKQNDNITEHNVVKEEISCDDNKAPGLPVPKESGTEVAENPLPSPLVATSTEEMSSEEVGYDKRNVAGDLDIPAEKLNHKEDTSAETIIEAISDNCGLQEEESSFLQENQYKPSGEIAASQSNPTATEKTGDNSTILVEDGQMKHEECLEKKNDNTSLTVATRDEVEDGALKVTHKVKFEEEIDLLKEQTEKPKDILNVAVEDIKAPVFCQDTKTTNSLEDGSHNADARDILSDKTEERTADVVAPEKTLAVQNVETTFSSEGTEDNSNTEVDESQVKQEECFEKETKDSSQGKAPVADELKVQDEENALLKEETQKQKHVESLPDASEDIRRAVSSQNVETTIYPEQNLPADSPENLDDQIKDKTVDVMKDASLENIATAVSNEETENNLATQADGSEMELDNLKDSEKPSFVENSNRDLRKVPEGLRRPEFFVNEEITKSTLLKEEAQEEKPVKSSHVTHEHVKTSALNPDDGTTNSFEDKSAAIVSNEDVVENLLIQVDCSEIEQPEKDCEKTSLTERSMGFTNAGLSAVTHEAETGDGDLRKDEIFCSDKYVGSALLKQEELIEKPIEYLKEAPEVIESSDSNQDIETTSSLKESIEGVSKTASNEETEDNSLIGVDESQVKNDEHLVKESEEPPVGKDPMMDAASIVSHEPKIESTSDLPENTLLKVEADTEKSMENTYTNVEQNLTTDLEGTLEQKIEDMAMDKLETKEKPTEIAATFVSNEEIKESSSIKVDDSQIEQDKESKKESEQQSITESFTRDIKDDDETIIMEKLKNEDLSRAELFQYEGNTECTLIKEEAQEKPLEPLHSAPDEYNSLREDTEVEKEAHDEKSMESVHIAPNDALSQNMEVAKAKADEVEPIESFYALDDDKAFGQNIEVAAVQAKSHVAHENDNALRQVTEVAKDKIMQEDKHLESLQVAAEDKKLDQCTTVVREKVEEEIVAESLHVVHADDKTSQVIGESNEVEEDKPSEGLHVEYKDDNLSRDMKISKRDAEEEEESMECLQVTCEDDNTFSQDKGIAKTETENETSVKYLNVAPEDDKALSQKTEVAKEETTEEKPTVSLGEVCGDDNPLRQEKEISKVDSEEETSNSLYVAPKDDKALSKQFEVAKKETSEEMLVESKHVACEDDNSLSRDKEMAKVYSEEVKFANSFDVVPEDDVTLAKEETSEEKLMESSCIDCEDDKSLIQDKEIAKADAKYETSTKSLNVVFDDAKALSQTAEVAKEKAKEEQHVASLHLACEDANSPGQGNEIAATNSEKETSANSSNVAPEDDTELNRKIEVPNEETGEEKFVESLHLACESDNSLSQDKEIPEANSEEDASAKPLYVACEDDDSLNQGKEIAKVDEKERTAKSLNVAPQDDKALSQVTEVAIEEKPMESLHVVFQDDNSLRQHEEILKVDLEEETSAKSLNVAPEDDDTLSEKAEVANEETREVKYGESLHVACEEHSSLTLSEEKGIPNAEPEETSAKSLNVVHEDDYKKIEETNEEIEKPVETLHVTDEEKALNQDMAISQEELDEEKPVSTLHLAPEHDVVLHEETEVVKKEIEDEKPIELLHVAPKDDEALSQDREAVKQTAEEEHTKSYIAPQDDKPLSRDIEAAKEEVEEERHVEPFHAALEKGKESIEDTTPANEDVEEQHAESSDVTSKNDCEYTSEKEDENDIVASHQTIEHQSKEIKEELNDVVCQIKVQEDPDITTTDKDINLQMTDNQHCTTPHPIDTGVTDGSIDTSQETTEFDGKNSSDDIENVHVGEEIPRDEKEKTITEIPIQEAQEIYQESDVNNSTRIIHKGSEEMNNFANISTEQVKEVVSYKDETRTVEPDTKVPENIENGDRNMEADEIIKEEGVPKDLQKITAVAHEEKGEETQYIKNPEIKDSDATEEMVVNNAKDSNCNQEDSSMTQMSKETQISHDKSTDVTRQVSEASEDNSDHKSVEEISCNESTEFKKMEVLNNDPTTITTKEILVEPETQQIQVSDAVQGVEKEHPVSVSQDLIEAYDITEETPELEGASQAALNEIKIENRELHIGETEGLENEEAGTEKDKKEEEAKQKISDCDSGTPILMEAIDEDLSRLADEEPQKNVTSENLKEANSFQGTDTRESILNDEDSLNYNDREVEAGYISQSKDILASTGMEEVLDSVTQVQNCSVISEAEDAEKEEKFEAAPTEIKPDEIVSEETSEPKGTVFEAQANMLREKIDKEEHDTENGSCEKEIIRRSCKENEANQLEDPQIKGEEIFEFIRNPNEDKEVKDSDFVFLDGKENKAEADYIDTTGLLTKNANSSMVNAAGPELQEKLNEDTVPAAAPTELAQNVAEDYEGDTNSTAIPLKDETCTSDKVELKDEKTAMLSAEYTEEKALKFEDLPIDKQVGVAVDHTENANPDSSICNKHILVPESKDSKESPSLAESEESASKETHEEANCENEERKSDETKSGETSEPIEVPTPSLSELLHKVSAEETIPMAEKCITDEEPAIHGEQLQAEKSNEETKTGEEKDDEEESGEHHKSDSSSEAPVMVEAGDADVKVAHKKSHHLLSGVGSKVKHSIANIKKAITGKSSHPKPTSPK